MKFVYLWYWEISYGMNNAKRERKKDNKKNSDRRKWLKKKEKISQRKKKKTPKSFSKFFLKILFILSNLNNYGCV